MSIVLKISSDFIPQINIICYNKIIKIILFIKITTNKITLNFF